MKRFLPDSIETFRLLKSIPDSHRVDNNMFFLDGLFVVIYPPLESPPIELFAALTDEPPSIHGT
jgi:hypothetical protein